MQRMNYRALVPPRWLETRALLLAVLILVFGLLSCNPKPAPSTNTKTQVGRTGGPPARETTESPEASRRILLGQSFGELLSELPVVPGSTPQQEPPAQAGEIISLPAGFIYTDKLADLTPAEKRMTGVLDLGEGVTFAPKTIVAKVIDYAVAHGELPQDGLELCPQLKEPGQIKDWMTLSRSMQYMNMAAAVNPISGSVYQTFEPEVWEPGAICIQRIEPTSYSASHKLETDPAKIGNRQPSVWRVVVCGENNDKILQDDFQVLYFEPGQLVPWHGKLHRADEPNPFLDAGNPD